MTCHSRVLAIQKGDKKYIADNPCKVGHSPCYRYVSNNDCVECEHIRKKTPSYKEKKRLARSKPEQRKKQFEYYYRSDIQIKLKQNRKIYKKENKEKVASDSRYRQALKLNRIPKWANKELILEKYNEAKRLEELTGIKYHVDHIIPLQGRVVSGLHVENNLRVIPAKENLSKHNQLIEELL